MTSGDKRVLYWSRSEQDFSRLEAALARAQAEGEPTAELCARWERCPTTTALLTELERHYVNAIVLDLRGPAADFGARAAEAFALLEALDRREDIEERYAFDRILVLLPADATLEIDRVLLELGARGVRGVLRPPEAALDADGRGADRDVVDAVCHMLRARTRGQRALCASGGGITGIYFELGALKCLDDCLGEGGVNAFDMYFGISAGAVVTAPLAAGYSVDEFMAAIAGEPGGRVAPIDLRLFRFDHIDGPGFARRAAATARTAASGLWSTLRGRNPSAGEPRFIHYPDLVPAPFRADRFERVLRGVLTAPGATNDFRALPRPLFVGATDQDTRAHVLFGAEGHDDVPISRAVQASLSLNPAFTATRIGGRFYEDGAVTRTSNFVEAIRRGATLVVVLDPFVPYVAPEPGFADRRGMLYNIDQDVRTISFTRYETTRRWVLRQHPEVSAYTLVPANRVRRLMSVNPMNHRPYLEIWRGAYLSTFARLRAIAHRLGGDLTAHGLPFDLARATAVADQLARAERPAFADFFPDRRVAVRQRPLCLEASAPATATPRTAPPGAAGR